MISNNSEKIKKLYDSVVIVDGKYYYERKRQGRSKETRERIKKRIKQTSNNKKINHFLCIECHSDIIICHNLGEGVCPNCGLVAEDLGRFDYQAPLHDKGNLSKPYRTIDYGRERLSQLNCSDPPIWPEELDIFIDFIKKDFEVQTKEYEFKKNLPDIETWGKITFGEIFRFLGLGGRKYGERWIQLRQHLRNAGYNFLPDYGWKSMDRTIFEKVSAMTNQAANVYKTYLAKKTINGIYFGNNVLCLNYIFIQCLRLLGAFQNHWKYYICMTKDEKKLEIYNKKWEVMISYLKEEKFINIDMALYSQSTKEGEPTRFYINPSDYYIWEFKELKRIDYLTNVNFR